jgi:hypothetical protein
MREQTPPVEKLLLSLFFLGKEIVRLGLKLDYAKSDLNIVLQDIRDEVAAM